MDTRANGRVVGLLYNVTDSTIEYVAMTGESVRKLRSGKPEIISIPLNEISRIAIRHWRPERTFSRIGLGVFGTGSLAVLAFPGKENSFADGIYRVVLRPFFATMLAIPSVPLGLKSSLFPRKILRPNQAGSFADIKGTLVHYAYRL